MLSTRSVILATALSLLVSSQAWAEGEEGTPGESGEAAAPVEGGEPAPAEAPVGEEPIRGVHKSKSMGAGARFRVVNVPKWLLNLFLDHSTGMTSIGIGGEFILHRRPDFDVVFGLEYENISPSNGLYLEKGDVPGTNGGNPDYTEFDNFAFLSIDASFIWHTALASKVDLRYGAGIGLGIPMGNIYSTDTACPPGTTIGQLDNPSVCPVVPGAPREKKDIPPVVPVVNLLIGTRIKATDNIVINVELGFRNMFFGGVGVEYLF